MSKSVSLAKLERLSQNQSEQNAEYEDRKSPNETVRCDRSFPKPLDHFFETSVL